MGNAGSIEDTSVRVAGLGGVEIDRISEDAIRRLADNFYASVRADSELGPILAGAIAGAQSNARSIGSWMSLSN